MASTLSSPRRSRPSACAWRARRATLEDLLHAGKDFGGPDPLDRALRQPKGGGRPRFEDVLAEAEKRKKRDLGDLL